MSNVPDNWYEIGRQKLNEEIEGLPASHVYSYLSNIGLIDYDIEKDILYERYFGEDD